MSWALPSQFLMYPRPTGYADGDGDGTAITRQNESCTTRCARGRSEQPTHGGHGRAQQRVSSQLCPQEATETCGKTGGGGAGGCGTGRHPEVVSGRPLMRK